MLPAIVFASSGCSPCMAADSAGSGCKQRTRNRVQPLRHILAFILLPDAFHRSQSQPDENPEHATRDGIVPEISTIFRSLRFGSRLNLDQMKGDRGSAKVKDAFLADPSDSFWAALSTSFNISSALAGWYPGNHDEEWHKYCDPNFA